MIAWLSGWAATLRIMIFERDTYRFLRNLEDFNPDDFEEVGAP